MAGRVAGVCLVTILLASCAAGTVSQALFGMRDTRPMLLLYAWVKRP